jgi:restriction system protein
MISGPVGGPSPPGSPGPGIGRGFFDIWFSQDQEAHDIAARNSWVRGPPLPPPVSVLSERDELLSNPPLEVMLQAVVTLGEKTSEGHVIEAVAIPWLAFLDHLKRNPGAIHAIDWRKVEEVIAAGYADSGYSVILTPRSGDKGRDVIATKYDGVSVRILDQVKAYTPGHVVSLDDVHAMLGVLCSEQNVSKGIITTTSEFAPGVYTDENVKRFMPYRLDLRPKNALLEWLDQVANERAQVGEK